MSEFKVGDRVSVKGERGEWLVSRIVMEDIHTLQDARGQRSITTSAAYLTPIPDAPAEIEWGPWVDGPDGVFIVTSRYQSECEHGRVIRYRLPLPKPEPIVTVRNQRLRFDDDGDLLWSLAGRHADYFYARVTRTTLNGETIDVKIEVLK